MTHPAEDALLGRTPPAPARTPWVSDWVPPRNPAPTPTGDPVPVLASTPALRAARLHAALGDSLTAAALAAGLGDLQVYPDHLGLGLRLDASAALALVGLLEAAGRHGCAATGACSFEARDGASTAASVDDDVDLQEWDHHVFLQARQDFAVEVEGETPTAFQAYLGRAFDRLAEGLPPFPVGEWEWDGLTDDEKDDLRSGLLGRLGVADRNLREAEDRANRA